MEGNRGNPFIFGPFLGGEGSITPNLQLATLKTNMAPKGRSSDHPFSYVSFRKGS